MTLKEARRKLNGLKYIYFFNLKIKNGITYFEGELGLAYPPGATSADLRATADIMDKAVTTSDLYANGGD